MYDRELIDYIPPVLNGAREYRALLSVENYEVSTLWGQCQAALNNQLVRFADENGVKRWEAILKINPKATATLDERKFTILTRLAEQLPYTIRRLRQMLTELCGADGFKLTLDANHYTLTVLVALTATSNFNDVGEMLKRICPANLIVILSIEYNQWYKFEPFTWADLGGKTWDQLRNEVL